MTASFRDVKILKRNPFWTKSMRKYQSIALATSLLLLASCGGNNEASSSLSNLFSSAANSTSQALESLAKTPIDKLSINPVSISATAPVSYYAAARFLEQASWGPTPQSIADVQSMGFSAWIDQQLAASPSLSNAPDYVINYTPDDGVTAVRAGEWWPSRFMALSLSGPDQLRQRVSWALYNYMPVNTGYAYLVPAYFDVLQQNGLSNYTQLLNAVTLSDAMADFLNLNQDVAGSPNENYAREVMQLFSVGMNLLNADGTYKTDANGNPLPTYTQNDVINATKALSGWQNQYLQTPKTNTSNYGMPMIPRGGTTHDTTQKVVLGQTIAAGQTIQQDLSSFINILVNHPNTAPFVSRRLIQSLVTSTPSPAYLSRIAQVFSSTQGDLSKVIKAILLDPEARAGDDPSNKNAVAGKIKEPILIQNEVLRALGCVTTVFSKSNPTQALNFGQTPYSAPSVFGYYSPDYQAPVSLYNAPEETLFTIGSIQNFNNLDSQLNGPGFTNAGCTINTFTDAATTSDAALIELLNQRLFRGAMPANLRLGVTTLLANNLASKPALDKVGYLVGMLVSSPIYGVVK
jgi:uncharacterized protein (DUF1800 family)